MRRGRLALLLRGESGLVGEGRVCDEVGLRPMQARRLRYGFRAAPDECVGKWFHFREILFTLPGMGPITTRSRGYLPHWETSGATYSVTMRLEDSLPQSVLDSYLRERQAILEVAEQQNRMLTSHEQTRLQELFSEKIDAALDQGAGECFLRDSRIGQMTFGALGFFHLRRYALHAWCVMPNHAHVLFTPYDRHTLSDILHSWKSYTVHRANKILGREGRFWMPESFDHLIRDSDDFYRARQYILDNPQKAHLGSWAWVASHPGAKP